jgi:hypothetical protein
MVGRATGIPATLKISVPLLAAGELYVAYRGQSSLNGESLNPEGSKGVSTCAASSIELRRMAGFFE